MTILKAENISKQYRLGVIGTGTLTHDLNRLWHRVRGKEDPYLKVGDVNDRSSKNKSEYVWALRDINFEVQQGEVLGIIGKNGAGKSTLLKILSRVTTPTTGEIKTRGRIASLLEVGTGFHPELTGRENIYLNGAILGMTRAEIDAKIDEIIEFSGCELYVDTPVKRYSSGMKVRLGFAVAAHLEPDILVVDEVLAVGDAEFQRKAIGKMQDISSQGGRTVLFVSHNMVSIQQLCTRCVILENGKTIFQGDVDVAISKYLAINNKKEEIHLPLICNKITILNYGILDHVNKHTGSVLMGDKCNLFITIKNNSARDLNLNVRFQIYSGKEVLITTLNTFHLNKNLIISDNQLVKYECLLNRVPFAEGKYILGIRITDLLEKEVLYTNDNWANFEVSAGDFYGTGKIPEAKNTGSFLIEPTWIVT